MFTLFNDLRCPTEIQELIWYQFIISTEPRTLKMKLRATKKPVGPDTVMYAYYSPHAIPTALHTSSQSRAAAKRRWKIAFKNCDDEEGVWVDFQTDTFAFLSDPFFVQKSHHRVLQTSLIEFNLASSSIERAQIRNVLLNWAGLLISHQLARKASVLAHLRNGGVLWTRGGLIVMIFPGLKELMLEEVKEPIDEEDIETFWVGAVMTESECLEDVKRRVEEIGGGVELVEECAL